MQAIILSGGKGTRLYPITKNIPKPLVPLDDMPILEVVLRQLKYYGFTNIILAVNHLAKLIMAFFGDGTRWNLELKYSIENQMLGTAGPVKLVNDLDENFIVMNGDILTTLNFADFMEFHVKNKNIVTIGTFQKKVKIDLGVLETNDEKFVNYIEKPTYSFDVSMGIYALNRKVLDYIPANQRFDMPELMIKLRDAGERIGCFKGDYYWLDIGRIDDYEEAVKIFVDKKSEFLYL